MYNLREGDFLVTKTGQTERTLAVPSNYWLLLASH